MSMTVSLLPRLQVEGQGLLPFTLDKQNLLLSSAISIANQQGLPLLSFNVSSWRPTSAIPATGNRHGYCLSLCLLSISTLNQQGLPAAVLHVSS